MRILHLTTHVNIGGITTYIAKLIKPFSRLGIETFVLSSGGSCTGDLQARGATTFELPIKTKNELHPKLFLAIPAVEKIIRENKINALHAHTRVTQVMAGIIQKRTGIPVITTCHGYFKRRLGRRLFPAWGDKAIAISQGVADHLFNDFRLPAIQIATINNGVDLSELEPAYSAWKPEDAKKKFGFAPDAPVVGVVARLVADKGHEYLIRALPILQKKFPSLRVLIVGDGRNMDFLKNLCRELKVENDVVFTGNLTDISPALAAMDIFTLPAVWREGFGLSIVEAMACRKPVIVSNIWSLNSLIESGVTGILIEPKQTEALAKAIEFLLTTPEEKARLAAAGRGMVEKFFTIDRMADSIRDVYREILSKSLTPPIGKL